MTEQAEDAVDILEKEMITFCNLVPVNVWGFDSDVKESLKMRKHSLVTRLLSKKERKSMSVQQKQNLAKGLGLVPNTVQEVLDWMSNSKQHSKVQPQKMAAPLKRPAEKMEKKKEKVVVKVQKAEDSGDSEEESEDEDSDEDDENEEAVEEPVAKKEKPQEDSEDSEESEDEENGDVKEEDVEEDSDSTDEEDEEPAPKKQKIVPQSTLKSNDKIEKEIKKLEEDEDNESPEIKRQIALLRLQKKLKEMKTERKGKGPAKMTAAMAAKMTEEKRLKRRESKMKLKQRRAEEKKGKLEVKKEAAEETENGEVGEKKKSGISFNNLKFEIKQEKQRGKKQRTAKKDRALKLTGRDYKSLIAKVEETKATIAKVREADPHKATIMEDELKWEKTLKRAAGGKVKDNLEMLKKALAKKNKQKDKKKEKWQNRENKVGDEKQTKQDKRNKNLQKRIDDVKKRKMNKLRAKGRIL